MKGKRVEGGVGGGGRMGRREKGKRERRRNVSEKGGRKFSGRWALCLDLCIWENFSRTSGGGRGTTFRVCSASRPLEVWTEERLAHWWGSGAGKALYQGGA